MCVRYCHIFKPGNRCKLMGKISLGENKALGHSINKRISFNKHWIKKDEKFWG